MNRHQFEHVLRAAAAISEETVFVVIGSQAVLAQFSEIPETMAQSVEVDLYPKFRPDLADLIDGAIGADSSFHETFGYHADGVGPRTARLPPDWESRALEVKIGVTTVICPEVNDLAVSKLLAARPKDLAWLSASMRAKLSSPEAMRGLLLAMTLGEEELELAQQRLRRLEAEFGD